MKIKLNLTLFFEKIDSITTYEFAFKFNIAKNNFASLEGNLRKQ